MVEQRRHGSIVPAALFGEEWFGYRIAGSSPKRFPKMPYQRRPSIRVIQNSSIPIPRVLGAGIIALAVNVLLLGLASHFGIDTAGGAFQRLIKLWTTPLKNEGSGKARNEGYQRKFNGRQFDISLEIRYPIWLDRNISRHSSC